MLLIQHFPCYLIRELLNYHININIGIFQGGGGGFTHSTKIINVDQKINKSRNNPNAMKQEIKQYKYFSNCDPVTQYPPSHLAKYLSDGQ